MIERVSVIISMIVIATILFIIFKNRKRPLPAFPSLQNNDRNILLQHVPFYSELDAVYKATFEERIHGFLSSVKKDNCHRGTETGKIHFEFRASVLQWQINFSAGEIKKLCGLLFYLIKIEYPFFCLSSPR